MEKVSLYIHAKHKQRSKEKVSTMLL